MRPSPGLPVQLNRKKLIVALVFLATLICFSDASAQKLASNATIWADTIDRPNWCFKKRPEYPQFQAGVRVFATDGHAVRFWDKPFHALWSDIRTAVLAACPAADEINFYAIPSKEDAYHPDADGWINFARGIHYVGHAEWTLEDTGRGARKEILPPGTPENADAPGFKELLYGTWTGHLCDRALKMVFYAGQLQTTVSQTHPSDGIFNPGYVRRTSVTNDVTIIRMKMSSWGQVRYDEYYLVTIPGPERFFFRGKDPRRDEHSDAGPYLVYDPNAQTLTGSYQTAFQYKCADVRLTKSSTSLDSELMSVKGLDFLHLFD